MSAQLETPVEGELVLATRNELAKFDPFEAQLSEFRERYDGIVYDLDNEAQNKQARSDRLAIGKVISRLDSQHKAIKEPLLNVTRELDGVRKGLKDGFLAMQGLIKSQIEAHEAKEQARIDEHFENISAIRGVLTITTDGEARALRIEQTLEQLRVLAIDDSYEEFKADAALAKSETIEALEKLLADRQKYEAEQAELERLRAEKAERERAEREARIAVEAAAKAKREAEEAAEKARLDAERKVAEERGRAERERREAVEKAERELAEANARAERAASQERDRIEWEQRDAARKAAVEREAEEKRKAQKKHRETIRKEATTSLIRAGIDEEVADEVIQLIADGGVMHVEIVF